MGRTLLLVGRPGIGKTTVIKQVVERLGDRAGGFYTEEIRGPGGRKGFRLLTLDGREAVMAHIDLKGGGRPRVSRYGVDVGAIERVGVAALRRAMQAGQVVVVDEVGKMELFCGPFKDVVIQAVNGPNPVIGTIMSKPNPWVDGEDRLSLGYFYEGPYTEMDVPENLYIYDNTFGAGVTEDDVIEGSVADVWTHAGLGWWGGGIHWATSEDLAVWTARGRCPGDVNDREKRGYGYQKAPYVFHWRRWYWMLTDPHQGLAVFRSPDAKTWELNGRILAEPG